MTPRTSRVVLEKEVAQAVIVLGSPGPPSDSADRYAVDVLMAVLSGMGNRLFYELRDRQHLCYFTGAFGMSLRAGGAVAAYIGTRPENEGQATEGLISELRKARDTEPTHEEMVRARNTIAGGYVIDLQRRAARASLLAQDEVSGLGYEEALSYLDRIRAVTADQVRDAAARYFNLEEYALAVLKPGTV
jgi:zinc protease